MSCYFTGAGGGTALATSRWLRRTVPKRCSGSSSSVSACTHQTHTSSNCMCLRSKITNYTFKTRSSIQLFNSILLAFRKKVQSEGLATTISSSQATACVSMRIPCASVDKLQVQGLGFNAKRRREPLYVRPG